MSPWCRGVGVAGGRRRVADLSALTKENADDQWTERACAKMLVFREFEEKLICAFTVN